LANLFWSWQITRFAKLKIANFWRCFNLAKIEKLPSVREYICAPIRLSSLFLSHTKSGGRVKKEIKNIEGFPMQMYKREKNSLTS
jgi:hypothetical protein